MSYIKNKNIKMPRIESIPFQNDINTFPTSSTALTASAPDELNVIDTGDGNWTDAKERLGESSLWG